MINSKIGPLSRRGWITTRSRRPPMTATTTTATTTATTSGNRCRLPIGPASKMVTMAPSITKSPWAKLMTPVTL